MTHETNITTRTKNGARPKRYQCLMICGTTIGGRSVGLEAAGSDGAKASG